MASGDTLLIYGPKATEPPGADAATLDLRNYHPVLDFDADASGTYSVFSGVMPRNYDGGGVTNYIHFSAPTGTAGEVIWGVSYERIGDGQQDLDADGWAAPQMVTGTVPATAGLVEIVNVAHTNGAQMDSIAVGELFRVRVHRAGSAAGDDLVDDAELSAFEIQET